jgi:hypothetical protein
MNTLLGREIGGVGYSLGLLLGLVLQSIMLFGFERWLYDQGGWLLLITGLVVHWSAILGAMMLLFALQKRRRDQAMNALLAEVAKPRSDGSEQPTSDVDES